MQNGQNSGPTAIVKQENFGGIQTASVQETASTAMAAMAKAQVEARSIMAMHRPRNLDLVRTDLLRECARPSFAAVAMYLKPIGQGIEGLSIRFVEQAMQILGNCESSATTVYDDAAKRIVEVRVMDYERNVCHSKQITVGKHVERSKLRHGQAAIGRRTGAGGQTVYIVAATDDDFLNKEAALVSKATRTCGLRLIPGWLQDEATVAIRATAANDAAVDPDLKKKQVADAFAGLNVKPTDLEEYLGHGLAQVSPVEIAELKQIYATIRDGQATWQDTIEHRREQRGEQAPQKAPATTAAKGAQAVKDKLAGKKTPPAANHATPEQVKALVKDAPPIETKTVEQTNKEQQAAKEATQAGVEAKGVAPGAKKPSRSKAAQAERQAEVEPMNLAPSKCLTYYVQNGDPRNLVKAQELTAAAAKAAEAPAEDPVADMEQAAMDAAHESVQREAKERAQAALDAERLAVKAKVENTATAEDGTQYDKTTGEVTAESEEPAWMRGGPPPDEEF